jgi:hypothetical protein
MSFRDNYRDFEQVAREWAWLNRHNLKFSEGDPQDDFLLMSEATMAIVAIERFVRMAMLKNDKASDGESLYNLLQRAVSKRILRLPPDDQQKAIEDLCRVRNTILHGNFEQAAAQANCTSAPEVGALGGILDCLVAQIDQVTGLPVAWLSTFASDG